MLDHESIIAQALQIAVVAGWTPPPDVIDQIVAGGLLTTSQVMDACDISKTTVHRWMADAEVKGRPLGVLSPIGYLIGTVRLLDYVEATQSRHERNIVEGRAAKYANIWSQPAQQELEAACAR